MIDLSFEFFPPKTIEGEKKFLIAKSLLFSLKPKFISITFGAGGSQKKNTSNVVLDIKKDGYEVTPHLSCFGLKKIDIKNILDLYKYNGIKSVLALKGDFTNINNEETEFYYAYELISFIRNKYFEWFHIMIAAYPEYHPKSISPKKDFENFIKKVNSGANSAITQYFFNADGYFRFVDDVRKLGINIPIIPGIMPITNFLQLVNFSKKNGAEIPRWIMLRMEDFKEDKKSMFEFGIEVVSKLCQRLIDSGVPGLHFYTLNNANTTFSICKNINY